MIKYQTIELGINFPELGSKCTEKYYKPHSLEGQLTGTSERWDPRQTLLTSYVPSRLIRP